MQATGETCEREAVYEGRCGCARWLPIGESAEFPPCPVHGHILWQAVKLEAPASSRRTVDPPPGPGLRRTTPDLLLDVA